MNFFNERLPAECLSVARHIQAFQPYCVICIHYKTFAKVGGKVYRKISGRDFDKPKNCLRTAENTEDIQRK